jgi:hypothetical protein
VITRFSAADLACTPDKKINQESYSSQMIHIAGKRDLNVVWSSVIVKSHGIDGSTLRTVWWSENTDSTSVPQCLYVEERWEITYYLIPSGIKQDPDLTYSRCRKSTSRCSHNM